MDANFYGDGHQFRLKNRCSSIESTAIQILIRHVTVKNRALEVKNDCSKLSLHSLTKYLKLSLHEITRWQLKEKQKQTYMWSATDSGSKTLLLTHPVLFSVFSLPVVKQQSAERLKIRFVEVSVWSNFNILTHRLY